MSDRALPAMMAFLFLAIIFAFGGWVGSATSEKDDLLMDAICEKNFQGIRADQFCVKDGNIVFTFPEVK